MTANLVSAPLPGDVVRCNHNSISPGLDHVQCKNCRRCWPHWHPDYERLLNQPTEVAPERETVLEQIIEVAPEQPHWIETYSPSGKKHLYYRYIWMEGRKLHHIHIPGGNIKSSRALAHFEKVERAIALLMWPSEIEELIKSFKNG